jgi:hypothetical protein
MAMAIARGAEQRGEGKEKKGKKREEEWEKVGRQWQRKREGVGGPGLSVSPSVQLWCFV